MPIRGRGKMTMKGIRFLSFFLAALLTMSFTMVSGAAAADAPKEILIGGTAAATGKFSGYGELYKAMHENWASMINERGGLYVKEYGKRIPVRVITYDDKSDPNTSVKFYERLVTVDKVDLLIGPFSSPLTFAASTVAEKHKVPMVAICANSPKIYSRGFNWIVGVLDSGAKWSYLYFDMLKNEGKVKTVALISEDNLHSKGVYKGALQIAQDMGFKVVFKEIAPGNNRDFTPIITKLKALNPDVVLISAYHNFEVTFMKQAKEFGLNPREFHVTHPGKGFDGPLGDDANYVTGDIYWLPGITFGDTGFYRELLDRSGMTVAKYPYSAIRMTALETVAAAIEQAGTLDKAKLMETLKKINIMTIGGPMSFQPNGVGTYNPFPVQFKDGKYFAVWPPEIVTTKHIYPTPPWGNR
jgi:branched-chain amino acid transport system substrate-binding protein